MPNFVNPRIQLRRFGSSDYAVGGGRRWKFTSVTSGECVVCGQPVVGTHWRNMQGFEALHQECSEVEPRKKWSHTA